VKKAGPSQKKKKKTRAEREGKRKPNALGLSLQRVSTEGMEKVKRMAKGQVKKGKIGSRAVTGGYSPLEKSTPREIRKTGRAETSVEC